MGRSIKFIPGEIYHIYNRGTEKRNIFSSRRDYERFLALLYLSNGEIPVHSQLQGSTLKEVQKNDQGKKLVEIIAYCLMPNHFHLLVSEKNQNGISRFMQKLITAYTMYFNKLHERSGALFQGKFQARHVFDERYFFYLISYIHLNPVKIIDPKWKENGVTNRSRAEKYLKEYPYSSYLDYLGEDRTEKIILNRDVLDRYADTPADFKASIMSFLGYEETYFKVRP